MTSSQKTRWERINARLNVGFSSIISVFCWVVYIGLVVLAFHSIVAAHLDCVGKWDVGTVSGWKIIGVLILLLSMISLKTHTDAQMETANVEGKRITSGYYALILVLITFLVVFVASLVAVMFSDCASECFGRLFGIDDKKETITFIGLGISGLILLLGTISISKRADAQVENNRLVQSGNDDERFTAAVHHLGSETPSARISSFYEFHYLAQYREHLRENIFNILCAHLRQTTTQPGYGQNEKPTEEVQSLLDVLFRPKGGYIFARLKADLRRVNLRGADLSGAKLRNADLSFSNLLSANLDGAKLQNARMRRTHLWGASLINSELQNIDADFAQLQGSDVVNCNLSNANLEKANLQGTKLWRSLFYAAELQNCNQQGTDLMKTQFQRSYIDTLKLQGAKFLETAMGGVTADHAPDDRSMTKRIKSKVNTEGNINDVIYFGDIDQDDINKTANFIRECKVHSKDESADKFLNRMTDYMDKRERKLLDFPPEGITLTPYTDDNAKYWIKEYNEAMKPPN